MEGKVLNYKLALLDESNNSILHSKMFETKEEAIKESDDKKDFMLFSLGKMEEGSYTWDLLPYGNYNSFKVGIWTKNFWGKYKGFIFIGIGTYIAYKLAFSLDKKTK